MSFPRRRLASQSLRFANSLLDLLIFLIVLVLSGMAMLLISSPLLDVMWKGLPILNLGVTAFWLAIYYIAFETLFGKSPAKFITRTRVVMTNGRSPSLRAVLLRTGCRFIPFEAFSFLRVTPVGWHDQFSSTRVVLDAPAPAPRRPGRLSPVRVRS